MKGSRGGRSRGKGVSGLVEGKGWWGGKGLGCRV